MLSILATDDWRAAHPGGTIGLLELSGVDNTGPSSGLGAHKRETEARLRERYQDFTRQDFLAIPVMSAYHQYYRRFDKTYHVQLQVESIVSKGKSLPDVSPLVDANFAAEVETFILTAGHDVAKLRGAVVMDVSREGDAMTLMSGAPKVIYAGDMVMRDDGGICCSIIYGQDNRSPITAGTSHVLYVAYAPAGVLEDRIESQLRKIEANVRFFSPAAAVEQLRLIHAEDVNASHSISFGDRG
jgi:DNA/RNA-binding domain of Phe-tRNA-synthetase-like protein